MKVLNGCNVGSTETKKLIQIKLDIGDLKNRSTICIDGFSERLKSLIPSLYSHKCSDGVAGGFFRTLDTGTSIANVIEHVALELQCIAGIEAGFSQTEKTNTSGIYNIVFNFVDEEAGIFAALASIEIVEALVNGKPYFIRHDIERLKSIYKQNQHVKKKFIEENASILAAKNQIVKGAYSVLPSANITLGIVPQRI